MAEKPHGQTWTWAILLGALVIGTWLRWNYVQGTPATLRAHDFQGHMDYLGFVLEHGRIPTATQGFQGYQPPLYYFIAAPIAAQVETGGRPDLGVLQQLALWTGVLSLAVGLWVGRLLLGARPGRLALFSLGLASFPGLVLGASRVGNDGLVQLLIFLGFAGLLCWWQTGRARWWFFAAAATGLGVLTKSNALVLLPIALGLLWIRPGLDKAARIRLLAWGGGTVAAISGWLIGIRLWLEQTPSVVPNTIYLPATLRLATSPSDLLWFNPVRVLEHPFGNHLGWLQQEQGLWEFYFRSAFFGEFPFDPGLRWTGWLILLLAMGMLPLIGLGLWRAIRSAPVEHAYLWMPVLMLLSIHGIYRVFAPFVPSQDFRYTSLVLLPAGALALQAADALPRWLRWLAWVAMAVLSGVCAVFLTRLVS